MIELDIKIRAKDQATVKLFTELMITGLNAANSMNQVDVHLYAEKDGDKITLTRKEIFIPSAPALKTPIKIFIEKSFDMSIRLENILLGVDDNSVTVPPFEFAEDITQQRFLKIPRAGNKSWEELESELKRQNIKY